MLNDFQSINCTSCSACSSICPKHLIQLIPDETGFCYPHVIDESKCTNCRLCERVCPILNQNFPKSTVLKTFAASNKADVETISSASGGTAAALSRKIISDGGIVYGVAYTHDFTRAEFKKATTYTDVEEFKGSKYIQADKNSIFQDVKDVLNSSNKKVLFIGLPCEIAGLKAYLGNKEYANLITVDLICYGPTSPKVEEEYIKYLTNKYHSRIIEFSVRYKKDGKWTPSYLRAKFENGKEYLTPFGRTEFGRAFSLLQRPSCCSCLFKGENHIADLTIGDYWGCTENDTFWNPHGVSVIFAHTEKGIKLLESVENLNLIESEYGHAVRKNQRYLSPRSFDSRRDFFTKDFIESGLFKACRNSKTFVDKLSDLKQLCYHLLK